MATDIVVTNGAFRLALGFMEVDTSDLGVNVCLRIDYAGTRQALAWTVDQLWIEYDALRTFEQGLRDGPDAWLRDMSDYAILHVERRSSGETLTINPPGERQSADGAAVAVRLALDSGSMQALHASLSAFPKWW